LRVLLHFVFLITPHDDESCLDAIGKIARITTLMKTWEESD